MDERSNRMGSGRARRAVKRRALLGIAGGMGAAAFLAACGGDDKGKKEEAAGGATIAPSTRVAETGRPKPGGTFQVRLAVNPPLDPHQNSTFAAQVIASYTYARLLKFKTGVDPAAANNYEIEGDLAEKVEVANDGLTVTYTLRPTAKWHDIAPVNGRPVDAEDVKFSADRFRTDPKSTNRSAFGTESNRLVDTVETPDPRTVVFKLAKPYGPFRNLTANSNYLWIMPKEIGAGAIDPSKQIIGAGPFMFESAQPDIAYRVRKNPAYHDAGKPYADGVSLNIIAEEAQEVAQFQAGRLDAANIPPERADEVRRSVPNAALLEYLPATYGFVAFQQRGATPFKDERVRRAAQMSIDRDGLLSLLYGDKGVWQSAVPANFGAWRLDPKSGEAGAAGQWFTYNPAEAKKLLAAAGYANGLPVRFAFTNNGYGERFNQGAEAIAGMMKEGGFNTQVITLDYLREFITPGTGAIWGNFEGMIYSLQASFGDPHDYLFTMHHTKSTRNHGGIADPMLDAMIDKEERTLDDRERQQQIKQIQQYVADKAYYGTTAVGPSFIGVQAWVKNYQHTNANGAGAEVWPKAWIDRGS